MTSTGPLLFVDESKVHLVLTAVRGCSYRGDCRGH